MNALQQLDQRDDNGRLRRQRAEHPLEDVGLQFGQANIQVILRHQGFAKAVVQCIGKPRRLFMGEAGLFQPAGELQGIQGGSCHIPTMKPLTAPVKKHMVTVELDNFHHGGHPPASRPARRFSHALFRGRRADVQGESLKARRPVHGWVINPRSATGLITRVAPVTADHGATGMSDTPNPSLDRLGLTDDLNRHIAQTAALIVVLRTTVEPGIAERYFGDALWLADDMMERIEACARKLEALHG